MGITPTHPENEQYGDRMQRAIRAQIKAEIAVRNLKQNDVAASAGLYSSTMSRYLRDSKPDMPLAALGAIAKALGLSIVTIVQRAERRTLEDNLFGSDGDAEPDAEADAMDL